MNYQDDLKAAIEAAGHTFTFNSDRREWAIDGCGAGMSDPLLRREVRVGCVSDAVTYQSVWRARRLTGDAKKDAAMLLSRHAAAVEQNESRERRDAARESREAKRESLAAAFDVGMVDVRDTGITFSFRVDDATPEMVARLAAAIRGAL